MHLSLTFPTSWVIKQAPNQQFVAILPGPAEVAAGLPEAIVTFGPIGIKPDEPRAWQEQQAASDLVAGTRARIGRSSDQTTTYGWPMRLVEAEVFRGNTDEIVEVRLCAFYTFMEHVAFAMVRAASHARLDAHAELLLSILVTGCPDWRGDPLCIDDLWDLEVKRAAKPRATYANQLGDIEATRALAEQTASLAENPTALAHLRRAGLLVELNRSTEAIEDLAAAAKLDPTLEPAQYLTGVVLGGLGQHEAAIVAWEHALALVPNRVDTLYNLAQARFSLKQFETALAGFREAAKLDPQDFMILRKVAQCLYALGRFDEAYQTRLAFREQWASTKDPRARFITEYVFDQFDAGGFWVHAVETLRPEKSSMQTLLTFRAVAVHGNHEHPLPTSVVIETSDQAKAAGTPFVLGLFTGKQFRVIATAKQLPSYGDLKQEVTRLLVGALQGLEPAQPAKPNEPSVTK